jgi:xanthine dehydrogenase YagS FAD-binding subunit
MEQFSYSRANDPAAAIGQVAADPRASFLAGGTTLVDLMKLGVETPDALVDINRLPLAQIEVRGDTIRVGAMVRNTELAYHDEVRRRYPMLSEALLSGATGQLRNMATVGGNLLQRTRCYYFRDVNSPCNKRQPGSGCSALEGFNRIHAVLGTSDKCIATHPSDMCVALAAMEQVMIEVQGSGGTRRIAFNSFYVPYGDDPARENVLQHGELITAIELPADPVLAKSHYLKVRDRASYEFALTSAAVALDVQEGSIRHARVALGGVATLPWPSSEAVNALNGKPANDETFKAAADAAMAAAKPRKHNAFKIELAKRTIVRALQTVAAMA